MDSINFCFILKSSRIGLGSAESFEKDYKNIYKPAAIFLYSHPNIKMCFLFNGVFLEFLKKEHSEFIDILKELISRKQIEILGGGYYDPVFPLLFPMDRSGQIELLSSEIRRTTGKRPRGLKICADSWDSSLLTAFATYGMEYILLDENIIPPEKLKFIPLIMSDKGKSLSIMPIYNSLKPILNTNCNAYLNSIAEKIHNIQKGSSSFLKEEKCVSLQFTVEEFAQLIPSGWLEKLETEIKENENFIFITPSQYLKYSIQKIPAYISAGISRDVGQWAQKPYKAVKVEKYYPVTIYDFFQVYPQSKALYDRMLYVSMLVNQCRGDKMRKKAAREKLWEAQNGDGFICTSKGAFVSSAYRQKAYKNLMEAEKIIRECEDFKESAASFDYNGDGLNEYVCRMENYFTCITLNGGAVCEFDVMQNSGNLADNLSRVKEFEGVEDDYSRGLFVDHVFSEKEFSNYLENKPSGSGIFSKMLYSELKFNSQRREIQLSVSALYQNRQKINLRKKYVLTSSGMMVQYIIKNESNEKLNAKFAVESSFAQTNFNEGDFNAFNLEIISENKKQEIDTKVSSKELKESGKIFNVEGFQLTDMDNEISFVFEPNESCGLSFVPIIFYRPEYTTGELKPAGMTFANTLFWDINLEPQMEMERTVNFSLFNQHKRNRNKKASD